MILCCIYVLYVFSSRFEHRKCAADHILPLFCFIFFGNKLSHQQMSFSVVNKVFIALEREALNLDAVFYWVVIVLIISINDHSRNPSVIHTFYIL